MGDLIAALVISRSCKTNRKDVQLQEVLNDTVFERNQYVEKFLATRSAWFQMSTHMHYVVLSVVKNR